jgi:tRNA1(Val) A37 N6-methylase TrmN6
MSDLQPGPDESLDKLIGDWKVLQLRRGHRFSTDDLVTAWRARAARPDATRLLDLGCGIGSVGLSTLHGLPAEASLVGVEVQDRSAGLAARSVRINDLHHRVRIVHGDLRDPEVLPADARFDLVTGSPPYVPVGSGIISPHPQRAGARMELRGSVFDYCAAARRWMAPGARFVFVMLAGDPRTEEAPAHAGLTVLERYDYVFGRKGTTTPHIATLVCARSEDEPDAERRTGCLVIRGPDGEWTDDYLAFRQTMGIQRP